MRGDGLRLCGDEAPPRPAGEPGYHTPRFVIACEVWSAKD